MKSTLKSTPDGQHKESDGCGDTLCHKGFDSLEQAFRHQLLSLSSQNIDFPAWVIVLCVSDCLSLWACDVLTHKSICITFLKEVKLLLGEYTLSW